VLASQVQPSPSLFKSGDRYILARCLSYLWPYWQLTGGAYLLLLIVTGLTLVIPQLIRYSVDRGIQGRDMRALGSSVLAILGVTLLKVG
jgi:ABC-type multidrug transport system fused ATPase/permease subunit